MDMLQNHSRRCYLQNIEIRMAALELSLQAGKEQPE